LSERVNMVLGEGRSLANLHWLDAPSPLLLPLTGSYCLDGKRRKAYP